MRGVALGGLAVVAAAALAVALFAWQSGRGSSFAGYSSAQLETLERAYRQAAAQRPETPLSTRSKSAQRALDEARDKADDAAISLELLQEEQRRRVLLWSGAASAVLATVLLVAVFLRTRRLEGSPEEARLMAALGTPDSILAAEQAQAAKLLGVPRDAPPEAVEEALAAQLAARDPSRLVGLAPQLQQLAGEQRQALLRARDCLLRVRTTPLQARRGAAAPNRTVPRLRT